eukprot:m.31468 g.31468  ORF g.31468 m.31468 type:complete len:514 (-) comp9757_c0_seq1:417-1958(-)
MAAVRAPFVVLVLGVMLVAFCPHPSDGSKRLTFNAKHVPSCADITDESECILKKTCGWAQGMGPCTACSSLDEDNCADTPGCDTKPHPPCVDDDQKLLEVSGCHVGNVQTMDKPDWTFSVGTRGNLNGQYFRVDGDVFLTDHNCKATVQGIVTTSRCTFAPGLPGFRVAAAACRLSYGSSVRYYQGPKLELHKWQHFEVVYDHGTVTLSVGLVTTVHQVEEYVPSKRQVRFGTQEALGDGSKCSVMWRGKLANVAVNDCSPKNLGDCATFGDKNKCVTAPGCGWFLGRGPCKSCSDFEDKVCERTPGCAWTGVYPCLDNRQRDAHHCTVAGVHHWSDDEPARSIGGAGQLVGNSDAGKPYLRVIAGLMYTDDACVRGAAGVASTAHCAFSADHRGFRISILQCRLAFSTFKKWYLGPEVPPNRWAHMEVVVHDGLVKLRIDKEVTVLELTEPYHAPQTPVWVGTQDGRTHSPNCHPFSGSIVNLQVQRCHPVKGHGDERVQSNKRRKTRHDEL